MFLCLNVDSVSNRKEIKIGITSGQGYGQGACHGIPATFSDAYKTTLPVCVKNVDCESLEEQ